MGRGLCVAFWVAVVAAAHGGESGNIHAVQSDLVVPAVAAGEPAAGRRVRVTHPDHAAGKLFHVLYLPPE